ncbi:FAD binding domain-containing protein [Delitschia confertaspora ATCC 74209]|uniref:FAD binding domain-containing protein n=1 Tax=Delitschia confertaspora ATCC 74209 TaxID=1513339 RepID=A0A9P4MY59_9PLEO|nr:FAD binding domain-containing protein [Delitschia confertaspora ATCC 74209]
MRPFSQFSLVFPFLCFLSSASAEPQADINVLVSSGRHYSCKCYPGDRCWPSTSKWATLNATVSRKLKKVIPDGAVCYDSFKGISTFNATACAEVNQNYFGEQWTTDRDVTNLWIYWTNNTCLPPVAGNTSATCTLGYYPELVIRAMTKQDIKASIDFARENNVRLVIRNTGHDFMGRSTGFGSLAVNTHSFKDVEFIKKYTGPGGWKGGAVKVGAGIQGRELLRLAYQQNPRVAIVTGECPTVGFAGGYIQGGGHGPLATLHGLAADQALSFEVVTADGVFRTANAKENPDLFWALRGGGPSTFAAIVSVTVKTFPETPSAGAIFRINATHTNDTEIFWKGFRAFHNLANHYVDNGMFVYYELFSGSLNVQPFVGPNMDVAKLKQVLKPLIDQLDRDKVPYDIVYKDYPDFFSLYIDLFADEGAGANVLAGGRLVSKTDIAKNANGVVDAIRQSITASQGGIVGHIVGPGYGAPVVDNAVNPVWRDGASFSITLVILPLNASLAEKAEGQRLLTDEVDKPLRDASPHGAAYVNEGNLEEPNWQNAFWGTNYPRLSLLKKTWDPKGVFYARTTPGSEDWEVIDYGTRLCRRL